MTDLRQTHATNARRRGENPEIAVGDVVLLQNDSTKQVMWKLVIVNALIAGIDGKIRAAVVRVADSGSLLKRSVKHLFPIEVKANIALPEPESHSEQGNDPVTAVSRPRRSAAINADFLRRLRS